MPSSKAPKNPLQERFVRSLLDILILSFLRSVPMHGYIINTELRKTFGRSFSPSTIYPLLYMLEDEGYVESMWKGRTARPKRVYALTIKGEEHLSSSAFILDRLMKKIKFRSEEMRET